MKIPLIVSLLIFFSSVQAQNNCNAQSSCNNYGNMYWDNSCESDCHDTCCWGSLEIGVDWIYWKPFQDNLDFATLFVQSPGPQLFTSEAKIIDPDFDHDSGFRVFATYCCGEDAWQVGLIYTHLMSHAKNHIATDPNAGPPSFIILNPNFFPNFIDNQASSLDTAYHIKINYLDLDFGRCYQCGYRFDITPHFGLRGWWMTQRLNSKGTVPEDEEGLVTFNSKLRDQFDGFGIEGGIVAGLDLCWSFYFTGYINASLLYARIKTVDNIEIFAESSTTIASRATSIHHLCPIIEGFIGIEYEYCFDVVTVDLRLGWEQHVILDANHFNFFDYGNLTLQGVTFGGSLVF